MQFLVNIIVWFNIKFYFYWYLIDINIVLIKFKILFFRVISNPNCLWRELIIINVLDIGLIIIIISIFLFILEINPQKDSPKMFYEYINMLHTRVSGAHGLVSYPKKSIREAVARQWRPVINYKSKKGGITATRSGNRGELRFRVKYEILLSTSRRCARIQGRICIRIHIRVVRY